MNRIDPWGLRDVDVYIWDWRGLGVVGDGSVGHVMITEHNSSEVILSLFPRNTWFSNPNTRYSVMDTHLKMGRSYDRMYVVKVPNDEAFDRVAADHRARDIWNWSPTNNNQTHCTRSAYDALKAGGVPLSGHDSSQILPRVLDELLEGLSIVYELQKPFNTTNGWGVTKIQ